MKKKERKAEKKRLIEALIGFPLTDSIKVTGTDCVLISRRDAEDLADKLIDANGVLVPPCKVGDQIFIGSGEFKDARMAEIIKIIFSLEKNEILYRPTDFHGMKLKSSFSEFEKTIFSTREAAEQALKERETK